MIKLLANGLLVLILAISQVNAQVSFYCDMLESTVASQDDCCCPHDHADPPLDFDAHQTTSSTECCQADISFNFESEELLEPLELKTGKDPPHFDTSNLYFLLQTATYESVSSLEPDWLIRRNKSATYLVTARIRI